MHRRMMRPRAFVTKPSRARPTNDRLYALLPCPYCQDDIEVPASGFDSWAARRIHDHLEHCSGYHWDVPTLRRSRKRDGQKPCGRERHGRLQLAIGPDGTLQRHPLGSLLRCCAPGRRALDAKPATAAAAILPATFQNRQALVA